MIDPDFDEYGDSRPGHQHEPFYSHVDTCFILRRQFLATCPDRHGLSATMKIGQKLSAIELFDAISETLHGIAGGAAPVLRPQTEQLFTLSAPNTVMAMILLPRDKNTDLTEARLQHFEVELTGAKDAVLASFKALRQRFGDGRLPSVSWWFMSNRGLDCRYIVMEKPKPVYDEFYPFFGEPVETFINKYLNSSASILFMMGEPGTGKTSFIRHMIYTRLLNAMMTYDEMLLKRDDFFIGFLTDQDKDVMVVEDADTMLGSRDSEGNKMISRFLNVSDGLIKLANKKMIFTTNLNDFSRVDPALTRPGRCFGAIDFRRLTAGEAYAASEVAGLPVPEDRDMTLAELFNAGDGRRAPEIRSIGF